MSRILSLIVILVLTSSCDKNKTIYVASSLANCENNTSKKCLQVKENQEDEWTVLNNDIEGFEHKAGFLQKIEVKISKIKNPTSDGAVFNYKFIKLIFEQELEVAAKSTLDSNYNGKWKINAINGLDDLAVQPTLNFNDGKISGNAGCNNYGTTYTLSGNEISFGMVNSTKMSCANMKIEKAFVSCLSKAKSYKLTDTLTIYDANGDELMSCSKLED